MSDIPTAIERDTMTIAGKGATVLLWSHAVLSPHTDLPRFCAYHEQNMARLAEVPAYLHDTFVQSAVITLGKVFQAALFGLLLPPPTASAADPGPTLTAELSNLPPLSRAARAYVALALDEVDVEFPARFRAAYNRNEDHSAIFEATVVLSQQALGRHSDPADPATQYRFLGQVFGAL